MAIKPLSSDQLYSRCDPAQFDFKHTGELDELTQIVGQDRAEQAIKFGIGVRHEGYNLYAMGPSGTGKHAVVRSYLEQAAEKQETPPDWCYVNNFSQPHKPKTLRLPPGRGGKLARDMEHLIEELSGAIPAAFESDEYRASAQAIEDEYKAKQEEAFNRLAEDAAKDNIKLFRTPAGFAFAPMKDDKVIGPEDFAKLPKEDQEHIEQRVERLQGKLQEIIQEIPQWRKETREKLNELNHDVTMAAVGHFIDEVENEYADLPAVADYLERVREDVVENVDVFRRSAEEGGEQLPPQAQQQPTDPKELHRYKVNLLVDNSETKGAPVAYVDHPTFQDLIGRVEHLAQFGTLTTDFTLLKPGALHRASGGYLMIDAHKVLTHPFAWDGLKRALYANEVTIEPLEKMLSLVSTVSLEPEPIPLDIKVVLVGDRLLYYLLHQYDPDFAELFKVEADFEERMDRTPENNQLYARLIGTLAGKEKLRPFNPDAVARVIEYGARHVDDSEKLTTHMRSVTDLLREADHWASTEGRDVVEAGHIKKAIDHQIYRASRVRERIQEEIQRGTILIDTDREVVGQVNGLSVLSLGNYAFGQPSRITATVHLGEGNVVDIEREAELGGSLHSKGVLILSSFLAARYAQKVPLSLSASLVFEQSYGMVDGDSASLGELCALLSALSRTPVRQPLAITGSVSQNGEAQPIGGVNEKIEGYFDVCSARGLDGSQGVIIPDANIKHLMLREDIIQAAEQDRFHIYPVTSVDEAVALLTGCEAGEQDTTGDYPRESLNGRVVERLKEMAAIRRSLAEKQKGKANT